MAAAMKSVVRLLELGSELTVEERNLFSAAYHNVVGARRASLNILSTIEQIAEQIVDDSKTKMSIMAFIKSYREKIETELKEICNDVLILLQDPLIPSASSGESIVFYFKMKGDYLSCLVEFGTETERNYIAEIALDAYIEALGVAKTELQATNPVRLWLALNFSVFYYEILNSPDEALDLAKTAFEEAIAELDTLSEESYKESTMIMQLLRDKITLWTSEKQEEGRKQETDQVKDPGADEVDNNAKTV